VAAKPRHALSSLMRPQGVVGAVSGLAPEIERKLTSMEGALGRGRGGPSRGFRTKRSWIRRQIVRISQEKRATHDESTEASETRLGRLREAENASSSARRQSVSARSRVVKRGAAR